MPEDNVNKAITATGAMAELTALFYKQLEAKGVPQEAATILTDTFLASTLHAKSQDNTEN